MPTILKVNAAAPDTPPAEPTEASGPRNVQVLSDEDYAKQRAALHGQPDPEATTPYDVLAWPMRAALRGAGTLDVWAGRKTPEEAEARTRAWADPLTNMGAVGLTTGALPAALGAGVPALSAPWLQAVLRTLTAGGTEGGLATARGEPFTPAAVQGSLGAGTGELVLGLGGLALSKALGKSGPVVSEARSAKLGKAAGTMLPELETETGAGLYELAQGQGKRTLDAIWQSTEGEIVSRLATRVPGVGTVTQRLTVPALGPTPMTYREAMESFFALKGAERYVARQQLVTELNRLDPTHEAGAILDETLKARSAGLAYLDVVRRAQDAEGQVDFRKLTRLVNQGKAKLMQRFGPYWEQAEAALLGGQRAPAALPEGTGQAAVRGLQDPGTRSLTDMLLQDPTMQGLAYHVLGRLNPAHWARKLGLPVPRDETEGLGGGD